MKALGVSGSPRRGGNTDYAVRTVLELIREHLPSVETEFMRVADHRIEHCRGCRECMETAECAIKGDDLDLLVEKMRRADLNVIGAPVYWYGPPGVMKDLIDRTHGFYPDSKRFEGKKVALISVAADYGYPGHERTMGWLEHYGAEVVAKIRLRAREKDDLRRRGAQKKLEAFAGRLAQQLS